VQLQTGYNQGGKTGSCAAVGRIQAGRKEWEQLQRGYKQGGKTGSYTAADRIQTWRKGRKLCRQDTICEKRQEAMQLQKRYK
jgi:hypothetical protein